MEQDYWNNMRDFRDNIADFFSTVKDDEKDLMNTTKNLAQRMRLHRQIDFTEDFKKKYMTREYGNYDKYEANQITEELEKGDDDPGLDKFYKNNEDMLKRINT